MMMEIDREDEDTFLVTIDGQRRTEHRVTVRDGYAQKLGAGDKEGLVRRSFEFLLEREPNTSILREFDLEKINDYFSEFEDEIRSQ